jgi:hypothetical protein
MAIANGPTAYHNLAWLSNPHKIVWNVLDDTSNFAQRKIVANPSTPTASAASQVSGKKARTGSPPARAFSLSRSQSDLSKRMHGVRGRSFALRNHQG